LHNYLDNKINIYLIMSIKLHKCQQQNGKTIIYGCQNNNVLVI
jgi:hypothetical protein